MRCPFCRESIPALGDAKTCPHCGQPIETSAGEKVRPIDLDYEALLADADARSLLWTRRGAIFAFVLGLIALVPIAGGAIAYMLLVVGQFVWAGFFVARPYHRHFSPIRRLVSRWVRRLSMIFVVIPLHFAAFVPWLALVASPAIFFGACWLVRAYSRFHFVREKNRVPVTWAEKLLLVLLAVVLVGGLCLAGVLVYLGVLGLDALGR